MSTNLQYRLQQLETVPPADVWMAVSERLDNEFNPIETRISARLGKHESTVPPQALNNIFAMLHDEAEILVSDDGSNAPPVIKLPRSERSNIFPIRLQKIAAAALLCLAVTALYYYMNTNTTVQKFSETVVPSQSEASVLPSLSPQTSTKRARLNTAPSTMLAGMGGNRMLLRKRPNTVPLSVAREPAETNDHPEISYADISTTDRLVSTEEIAIPTQPIRDGDGNIIMDEKLISAPDVNYVTVTGPNGEQTKISKKFLHGLSYMNAGFADDDFTGITIQESSLWKWLFQEWRRKLLSQPTFIPSATNFLDIIELKEILHENF